MNSDITIHCFRRNNRKKKKKNPGNYKLMFPVDSTSVICILICFLFPMTARISIMRIVFNFEFPDFCQDVEQLEFSTCNEQF